MNLENLVGQTLDGKYKIEKELGRGGMGAVYLATHIGTERPVAVKVIVPEFMERAEFVERFRREARAAGRLRHPNVVDVTDFGFAGTSGGQVAYLVMEYLDGCTLGEVLDEEGRLPLLFTLDILEQVCSAVAEAHRQGIIHRDLKPDNIWLEPNQRGGYTVKVLDFGIAKLEESEIKASAEIDGANFFRSTRKTQAFGHKDTIINDGQAQTFHNAKKNSTVLLENQTIGQTQNERTFSSEAGTLIQSASEIDLESGTAILPAVKLETNESENAKTKLVSAQIETDHSINKNYATDNSALEKKSTSQLTHVGAVLGTPLYMSPEQCRGEKLTAQSDIYSLGVIAYRMLSGKTPFEGDYMSVMKAHQESAPPVLEAKKVPRKVKEVISATMAKNPAERSQTAESFAAKLRAQSEGIGTLMQRALVIYSEHLPKFLLLAILLYLPVAIVTILQVLTGFLTVSETIDKSANTFFAIVFSLVSTFLGIFCGYLIFGTTTWLVTQILAAPLSPVKLRPALEITRQRWKTFAGTGMLSAILTLVGYVLCFVPGVILSVVWALVAPVVMMEGLRGLAALKRSKTLVRRSLRTTAGAMILMFLVPVMVSGLVAFVVNTTVNSFGKDDEKAAVSQADISKNEGKKSGDDSQDIVVERANGEQININIGADKNVRINNKGEEKDFGERLRAAIREALTQILLLPFSILVASFSSIVVALLYLKTRQIGGESIQELLGQFQETKQPQSNWQRRIRERLEHSGKLTSKS